MHEQIPIPAAPDPDPYRDPITMALVAEIFERGGKATARGVIERSGLGAEAFTSRYSTLEDCTLDCYERFKVAYERRIGSVFNAGSEWRDSLRAAAYETADLVEESYEVIHLGLSGILQLPVELALVRREELFLFCARLIDLGRTEPSSIEVDDTAPMFAVGSIMQLLTFRMQTGGPIEPHAIVPEMMASVVRIYKGEAAGTEELELGDPRPRASQSGTG